MSIEVDLVVGLPRGGVVVAAEVAEVLGRPLEVVVVRKIGHPLQSEFAVGAIAEDGVLVLDREAISQISPAESGLQDVIAKEQERLRAYCRTFHRESHKPETSPFAGQRILIVDDGLATGATAEAAVHAVRRKLAQKVILAVPVASTSATSRLARVTDQVVSLVTDPDFGAVGQYYLEFNQTSDEEVLALLHGLHAD